MAIFSAIGAAVTAVSGWIGGLGAFGAFALKTAVGIGLSFAAQALAGKPKTQEQKFSINTGLTGGGALSRSFIMGRAATGGSLVWANTWGGEQDAPNTWLTQVIALSDVPVKGLAELWVDGVRVTYNPALNNSTIYGQSIPQFAREGANLYVKFYDGTQTTADNTLLTRDSTTDRPWQSNRIGRGVAYAIIRARSSKGVFSGIPQFTFVVDGIRLYDPSRDSTNGGVGTQRYGDPTTWGGDGDYLPAVQIYNLMRGIKVNGQWIYGMQDVNAARLPPANWIRQINKCRQTIVESGGPQPTYRAGGQIDVSAPLSVALEELLTTCQGRIGETGGVYNLFVGEPDAPVFGITDGDIVSTEEQEFTPFIGLADSINGISATYPEPLDGYAERAAPPIVRPDLEALDGNRRLMADVQFTFVPYSEQVQRLMKSALLAALRYRRHTITLPPKFWRFAVPGETLLWTSERNGYVSKLFVIDGVSDKANLDVTIDITEYDPSDYSWNSGTEFQPPAPGSLGPIIPAPRPIVAPFAEPYILIDEETRARRPAIRLVWDAGEDTLVNVAGVEWEIRLAGTLDIILTGSTATPERGSVIISAGVLPNTNYEIRMRYIPDPGLAENLWSVFLPVRTDDVLLGVGDIEAYLRAIGADAKYVWEKLSEQLDDVWKRVEHVAQSTSLSDAVGTVERTELRAEVGQSRAAITTEREVRASQNAALARQLEVIEASTERNAASITNESIARADGDSALASQITSLSATVGENSSSILQEAETRASADEALATQITAVRAEIDAGFAEGMVRFEAVAAPAGVEVRYAVLIRAQQGDSFQQTGFYVEIYNDSGTLRSRTGFDTDQFVITAGTNRQQVFSFDENGAVLDVASVRLLRAGRMLSLNNKMEINLNNGTIVIRS